MICVWRRAPTTSHKCFLYAVLHLRGLFARHRCSERRSIAESGRVARETRAIVWERPFRRGNQSCLIRRLPVPRNDSPIFHEHFLAAPFSSVANILRFRINRLVRLIDIDALLGTRRHSSAPTGNDAKCGYFVKKPLTRSSEIRFRVNFSRPTP